MLTVFTSTFDNNLSWTVHTISCTIYLNQIYNYLDFVSTVSATPLNDVYTLIYCQSCWRFRSGRRIAGRRFTRFGRSNHDRVGILYFTKYHLIFWRPVLRLAGRVSSYYRTGLNIVFVNSDGMGWVRHSVGGDWKILSIISSLHACFPPGHLPPKTRCRTIAPPPEKRKTFTSPWERVSGHLPLPEKEWADIYLSLKWLWFTLSLLAWIVGKNKAIRGKPCSCLSYFMDFGVWQ